MATLDDTLSDFIVHSSDAAADSDQGDEERYEDDYSDEHSDEYQSEFEDERASARSHTATPPPHAGPAAASSDAEAWVDQPSVLEPHPQPVQISAAPAAASSAPIELTKPRLFQSRLPVRMATAKQLVSSASAPVSAPASRESSAAASEPPAIVTLSQPASARTAILAVTVPAPATLAASKPSKANSSSAPASKPPSRSTAKAPSSASAAAASTPSSLVSSSSASPASKSSNRYAAFVKPNKPTASASSASPSHKSAKPSFDFSTPKPTTTPTTTTTTTTSTSITTTHYSNHPSPPSKASPRLLQARRESHWDPTPFVPPIVPQFSTHTRPTQQPLLDVRQSAWQLQTARRLPVAPNVLLRVARSEVVTRMSEVVMRTRQLRRRTKDRVSGVGVREKAVSERVVEEKVAGGDGDGEVNGRVPVVPSLRLAVGERPEQSERRARHNSPLARDRVAGSQ